MKKKIGLILSIFFLVLSILLEPPENLSKQGFITIGVSIFISIWWITEIIPIPITSLLPILFFPILGIANIKEVTAPYSNPLIYLFLGGFMIALAMEKWGLHKRIALNIISFIGTSPKKIILGFLISTMFLSMWVNNTSTAMMMVSIALPIISILEKNNLRENSENIKNFTICLLLSIAYGASIGGLGTLIGTTPNAHMAGFLIQTYNLKINFISWMLVGVPVVIISIPILYFTLTKFLFPIGEFQTENLNIDKSVLGEMSFSEKVVAFVFVLVASLWVLQPLLIHISFLKNLSDTTIAIFGVLILFLVKNEKKESILDWETVKELPWDALLLFGGGLSLAAMIEKTKIAEWIGANSIYVQNFPFVLIIFITVALIIFLTELTSNLATVAVFLPIFTAVAVGLGKSPLFMAIPITLSASCAFMLPVGTPPNAIVYGTGKIQISNMIKAGIYLNIIYIFVISLIVISLGSLVFGI